MQTMTEVLLMMFFSTDTAETFNNGIFDRTKRKWTRVLDLLCFNLCRTLPTPSAVASKSQLNINRLRFLAFKFYFDYSV